MLIFPFLTEDYQKVYDYARTILEAPQHQSVKVLKTSTDFQFGIVFEIEGLIGAKSSNPFTRY